MCVWESLIKEGDTERNSEGCLLKLRSGNELFFCISTSQRDKTEPRSPVYDFNTLHINKGKNIEMVKHRYYYLYLWEEENTYYLFSLRV